MAELPVDVIRVPQSGADPGGEADKGKLYTKSVLSVAQPHYQASDGTVTQLSNAAITDGSVPYSSLTNKLNLNRKSVLLQSAAQGIFDSSIDAVTVLANTTYLIRGALFINLAVTLNTFISSSFLGTATYTSFNGTINQRIMDTFNIGLTASARVNHITTAAATAITAIFGTSGDRNYFFYYNLIAVINAGGTMIPSISFSQTPANGTYIGYAGLEIIPIGSNTFTQQNWG